MLINFFEDFTSLISEVKFEATHGKKHEILTPKKMLQRLLIALV